MFSPIYLLVLPLEVFLRLTRELLPHLLLGTDMVFKVEMSSARDRLSLPLSVLSSYLFVLLDLLVLWVGR